jgi:hypothetical protein
MKKNLILKDKYLKKEASWDEFYKWWLEFRKARVEDLKKFFDEGTAKIIFDYGTPALIGALLGAAYNFTLEPTQRNLLTYIALGSVLGLGAYALYRFLTDKSKPSSSTTSSAPPSTSSPPTVSGTTSATIPPYSTTPTPPPPTTPAASSPSTPTASSSSTSTASLPSAPSVSSSSAPSTTMPSTTTPSSATSSSTSPSSPSSTTSGASASSSTKNSPSGKSVSGSTDDEPENYKKQLDDLYNYFASNRDKIISYGPFLLSATGATFKDVFTIRSFSEFAASVALTRLFVDFSNQLLKADEILNSDKYTPEQKREFLSELNKLKENIDILYTKLSDFYEKVSKEKILSDPNMETKHHLEARNNLRSSFENLFTDEEKEQLKNIYNYYHLMYFRLLGGKAYSDSKDPSDYVYYIGPTLFPEDFDNPKSRLYPIYLMSEKLGLIKPIVNIPDGAREFPPSEKSLFTHPINPSIPPINLPKPLSPMIIPKSNISADYTTPFKSNFGGSHLKNVNLSENKFLSDLIPPKESSFFDSSPIKV